jgi:hypothetical protein
MSHIAIRETPRDFPSTWKPDVIVTLCETACRETERFPEAHEAALRHDQPFFAVATGRGGVGTRMLESIAALENLVRVTGSGMFPHPIELHVLASPAIEARCDAIMRELQLVTADSGTA